MTELIKEQVWMEQDFDVIHEHPFVAYPCIWWALFHWEKGKKPVCRDQIRCLRQFCQRLRPGNQGPRKALPSPETGLRIPESGKAWVPVCRRWIRLTGFQSSWKWTLYSLEIWKCRNGHETLWKWQQKHKHKTLLTVQNIRNKMANCCEIDQIHF